MSGKVHWTSVCVEEEFWRSDTQELRCIESKNMRETFLIMFWHIYIGEGEIIKLWSMVWFKTLCSYNSQGMYIFNLIVFTYPNGQDLTNIIQGLYPNPKLYD